MTKMAHKLIFCVFSKKGLMRLLQNLNNKAALITSLITCTRCHEDDSHHEHGSYYEDGSYYDKAIKRK